MTSARHGGAPQRRYLSATPAVQSLQPATPSPTDPTKFAVIISGVSGEETYAELFARWSADLYQALTKRLGFAADHVTLLAESPTPATTGIVSGKATADGVRRALEALRTRAKTEHTVFLFLIGHGTFDGREAKFNLVGPDLPAAAYNQLLNGLAARRIVIVNMSSASGEFIRALAAPGRVVITATRSGQEQNATRFAQYFIEALSNPAADADQNGRISVLEAFDYATKLTAEWYKQAGRLATEHALLEDNGDGIGHQSAEGGDGILARATYFDSPQATTKSPEAAKLLPEKTRLEGEIEQLKLRKEAMPPSEYETRLEKLLVDLARVSQRIRAGEKRQ